MLRIVDCTLNPAICLIWDCEQTRCSRLDHSAACNAALSDSPLLRGLGSTIKPSLSGTSLPRFVSTSHTSPLHHPVEYPRHADEQQGTLPAHILQARPPGSCGRRWQSIFTGDQKERALQAVSHIDIKGCVRFMESAATHCPHSHRPAFSFDLFLSGSGTVASSGLQSSRQQRKDPLEG